MFRTLRGLLAQSRRIGDVERTLQTMVASLESQQRELEQLRADVEWLGGDFRKLKGRVTGSIRKEREAEAAPNGGDDAERINDQIRQGSYTRTRRSQ